MHKWTIGYVVRPVLLHCVLLSSGNIGVDKSCDGAKCCSVCCCQMVKPALRTSGADIIVDHDGGPYLTDNIRSAAIAGRVIGVGRLGRSEGVLDLGGPRL